MHYVNLIFCSVSVSHHHTNKTLSCNVSCFLIAASMAAKSRLFHFKSWRMHSWLCSSLNSTLCSCNDNTIWCQCFAPQVSMKNREDLCSVSQQSLIRPGQNWFLKPLQQRSSFRFNRCEYFCKALHPVHNSNFRHLLQACWGCLHACSPTFSYPNSWTNSMKAWNV